MCILIVGVLVMFTGNKLLIQFSKVNESLSTRPQSAISQKRHVLLLGHVGLSVRKTPKYPNGI